jgi:hypothetical protein
LPPATSDACEWDESPSEECQPYVALSRAAVTAFIVGLLSVVALATEVLVAVPALGLVLGVIGWRRIRRYPDEFTGRGLTVAGVVLNLAWLLGSVAYHATVYATELPPGCQRISFADLQPSKNAPQSPVPPEALDLNGKRVFVKGYVYPDGQQYNIKQFVLVPDMGTCCFGGQPKLTDMIQVTLRDPLRVEFARRLRRLAGTLTVDVRLKPVSGLHGVYYQLDADYVR